jgi:hypothetical protein
MATSTIFIIKARTGLTLLAQAKNDSHLDFFMEIFLVAAWEIWKQRNNKIFRRATPSFNNWKTSFFATLRHCSYKLSVQARHSVQNWLNTLS